MKYSIFMNRAFFLSLIAILFFQNLNAEEKGCEALIRDNQCMDAIAVCSLAAEENNPKAQLALSKLYSGTLYGDFRRNYKKSFQWMEAAANQGNTDAEVEMAEMYIRGEVIPMNARKAKTWYEKAAAKDDLDGINGLARLYRYGSGVRKDQEKAFEYYQEASLQGHTRSQVGLGMAYRDARGVKKNLVYAYAWLLIAAEKITDQEYKSYRKDYEDRQENFNRDNPQCEYILEGKSFGHIFAVGYAKQLLKDLKKRLSIKQIRKSEALAEELKLNIQ
jgi:TPR repeat protein